MSCWHFSLPSAWRSGVATNNKSAAETNAAKAVLTNCLFKESLPLLVDGPLCAWQILPKLARAARCNHWIAPRIAPRSEPSSAREDVFPSHLYRIPPLSRHVLHCGGTIQFVPGERLALNGSLQRAK